MAFKKVDKQDYGDNNNDCKTHRR